MTSFFCRARSASAFRGSAGVAATAAIGSVLIVALAIPTSAAAATDLEALPPSPEVAFAPGAKIPLDLLDADGAVDVFIETSGDGALSVQQAERGSGSSQRAAAAEASEVAAQNERVAQDVAAEVTAADPDAEVLYTSSYSVPGVAVSADVATLAAVAERDDVVKVSRIVAQSIELPEATDAQPQNSASDALTKSVDAWQQTGRTGDDVTVAVIDTGLDYTHATFGGPGTTDAYKAALESTDAPEASWFDAAKYLGGWDFAGTTYNGAAGTKAYDPVPRPDANPIDGRGGGHGTHVSGTAAGFGVTPSGATFRGDYTELTSETVTDEFSIGPGSAPEAGIIALKVFGDGGGSTALTGAALEWIAKEVASGNDIDVVNLSLGTDHGTVDDPDNAKLAALMDAGVLPVVAAGNAGDETDIVGSPGTTERALTVAASASGGGLGDAVFAYTGDPAITPPQELLAQYSQNYFGTFSKMANVVQPQQATDLTGCSAFDAADAATMKGKIVWLAWDDADPACGSATRFDNAQKAGAIGVLLESQSNAFEGGIAGNSDIPGAQLTADSIAAVRPALEAGTLVVRLDSEGLGVLSYFDSARTDTPASFTSRGVHGSIDYTLKPDVSAPGVSIVSAANGTGSGRVAMSGTSMATPHTAGVAALVVDAHPDWSPDRVKQQVMNTAVHDITTTGEERIPYGPARVGVGRVDALAAVTTELGIRSVENEHLISASFGVVDAVEPTTLTRTIRIDNDEDAAQTLALRYTPRTETPGVAYRLSTDSVTVPAGGSVDVTLTMSIDDPTQLRRTIDPTMEAFLGGAPRQYLADASGIIEAVRSDGRPPLRLAVFVAPRPVSQTTVDGIAFAGDNGATAGTLSVSGTGLDQGEGTQRYRSLMVPLVLGVTDPDDTFPADSAQRTLESSDILAVGASSTAPLLSDPTTGILTFGIVMDGNWASLSALSYPMVQLDLNGDTRSDFTIIVQPGQGISDLPLAITVDSVTGAIVDQRPVNGAFGDQSTNIFDNNVMTVSTSLARLGYTADTTATSVRYLVQTRSYYNPGYDGDYRGTLVDQTSAATIDVYRPAMSFGTAGSDASTFADAAGTVAVTRLADSTAQALVLHLHGAEDARSQIITPTVPGVVTPEPTPSTPVPTPTGGGTPTGTPAAGGGSNGGLARTGGDASGWLAAGGIAGLLVAAGATMVVMRRRAESQRAR